MIDLFAVTMGTLVFGALLCGWRAWWLVRHWLPSAGHVLASSYTERMQLADVPPGQGMYARGRPGLRFAREQVQFEDAQGERHVVPLSRWVTRRYRPACDYVVWYDPACPARATACGPGYWAGAAAVLAGVLIAGVIAAAQLRGAARG